MMRKAKMIRYVVLAVVVGLGIWVSLFASHAHEVIAAVKDYGFALPERELERSVLRVIRADTNISYKVIRITDNNEGRKYDIDLSYQHNVEKYLYHVCLASSNSIFSPKTHSILHLTGALDMNAETGAAEITEKDMPKLIRKFEEMLITKLPRE